VTKGLLLLDVDGPLNPYRANPLRRRGYAPYTDAFGSWGVAKGLRRYRGYRVWLNSRHGAVLMALAAETDLQLVWATAWRHAANEKVAPAIGLEPIPVIEYSTDDAHVDENDRLHWRAGGGWKWPGVTAYAAGRPLAWLDDQHDDLDHALARAAFDRDRAGSPTLLCHVDPRTGLRSVHLDRIRRWAADLP
jgi:hypothetical protein